MRLSDYALILEQDIQHERGKCRRLVKNIYERAINPIELINKAIVWSQ